MPHQIPPFHPKIAIIGGGPGGLCLANILLRNAIPFTLFESDASPSARNQGGSLDLHAKYGQAALREAGLYEEFVRHSRPEADVMKIVAMDGGAVLWDGNVGGKDWREIMEEERERRGEGEGKPEIDRAVLNSILLAGLQGQNVKYGKKLDCVVENEATGKHTLLFRDGTTSTDFDVVVGADGAWSRVRQLLTPEGPFYSGISAVELWIDDVDAANPWLATYVGAGSLFSLDRDRTIQVQRLGNGSVRAYACLRKPEGFLEECGIDFGDEREARREYVQRFYGDAGEDLKRVILESTGRLVPRTLYMLPVGFRWEHRDGVTLLGDAAHLMTPFAGVGVNAALADAMELGRAIVRGVKSDGDGAEALVREIREYEVAMFERGEMFAARTWKGLQGHFSAGGSEAFAKKHRDGWAAIEARRAQRV